jgi:hypothetical protein
MTKGQFPVTDGSTYILDMTGEEPRLGFGLLRPEEAEVALVGYSSSPAERWNLESLLTTRLDVWVRTPI